MEQYIGVTGISSEKQVIALTDAFCEAKCSAKLNLGIVHSFGEQIHARVLAKNQIRDLLAFINEQYPGVYSTIHLNGWINRDKIDANFIESIPQTTFLQINKFNWTRESFGLLPKVFASRKIILTLNPLRTTVHDASEQIVNKPSSIAAVLIDSSEGTGQPFRYPLVRSLLASLRASCPNLRLGVAGGLSGDLSKSGLTALAHLMPVSCDAESKLRHNGVLDLARATRYLRSMQKVVSVTNYPTFSTESAEKSGKS